MLKLIPKSDTGISRHTGQRSVMTPRLPAIVDARLAPTGHVPFLMRKKISPLSKDSKAIMITVYQISSVVGSGLASLGSRSPMYPSSHAKNALSIMAEKTKGRQKFL